jgi:hypothetical protein
MQFKRNLSNSKAFTQLRKSEFTEIHPGDKGSKPVGRPFLHPGMEKQKAPRLGEEEQTVEPRGETSQVLTRLDRFN